VSEKRKVSIKMEILERGRPWKWKCKEHTYFFVHEKGFPVSPIGLLAVGRTRGVPSMPICQTVQLCTFQPPYLNSVVLVLQPFKTVLNMTLHSSVVTALGVWHDGLPVFHAASSQTALSDLAPSCSPTTDGRINLSCVSPFMVMPPNVLPASVIEL
jgi:hypothetical protein